jgi:RimJ/RimL family protein N-acetyltransferase
LGEISGNPLDLLDTSADSLRVGLAEELLGELLDVLSVTLACLAAAEPSPRPQKLSGGPVSDWEHQMGHPVPLDADRRIAQRDILQRHLAKVRASLSRERCTGGRAATQRSTDSRIMAFWQGGRVTHQERIDPSHADPVRRVQIMHLTAPVFRALAEGDLAAANEASPVLLSPYFAGPDWRRVWQMRLQQVQDDPASTAWVTGAIWDEQRRLAVGRAGYHGLPDPSGMVEIGYAVEPVFRRRGYARAALEALLRRAAAEPDVHTVRVTISPDNVASLQLASQYGFCEVGEQWDDEDGLEIVYEADANRRSSLIGGYRFVWGRPRS